MAISVTGARDFFREPDSATLVLSNKSVGALAVVSSITSRMGAINTKLSRISSLFERQQKFFAQEARNRAKEAYQEQQNSIRARSSSISGGQSSLVERPQTRLSEHQNNSKSLVQRFRDFRSNRAASAAAGAAAKGGGLGVTEAVIAGGAGATGIKVLSKIIGAGATVARFGATKAIPIAGLITTAPYIAKDIKDGKNVNYWDAAGAGSSAGAIIGSIIPGVGTAIGAAGGAVVGLAAAATYNSREQVAKYAGDMYQTFATSAGNVYNNTTTFFGSITAGLVEVSHKALASASAFWNDIVKTTDSWRASAKQWFVDQSKQISDWFNSLDLVIKGKSALSQVNEAMTAANNFLGGNNAAPAVPRRALNGRMQAGAGSTPGDFGNLTPSGPTGSSGDAGMYNNQAPTFNPLSTPGNRSGTSNFSIDGQNGPDVSGRVGSANGTFGTMGGTKGTAIQNMGGVNFGSNEKGGGRAITSGLSTAGNPEPGSLANQPRWGYDTRAGTAGEFNNAAKTGEFGAAGDSSNMTRITLASGKTAIVNKAAATQFKGFFDELEAGGYKINSLGGYNPRRNVNDPSKWSMHGYGTAMDVNPGANPNKGDYKTDLPKNVEDISWKHGLSWGARFGDSMHFEAMGKEARLSKLQELVKRGVIPQSTYDYVAKNGNLPPNGAAETAAPQAPISNDQILKDQRDDAAARAVNTPITKRGLMDFTGQAPSSTPDVATPPAAIPAPEAPPDVAVPPTLAPEEKPAQAPAPEPKRSAELKSNDRTNIDDIPLTSPDVNLAVLGMGDTA